VIACDTVILTGDWIPDNELARLRGLDFDRGSLSPLVDTSLRTTAEGIFAAGNLLHPVDTADVAALDGRHVATSVRDYLAGDRVEGRTCPVGRRLRDCVDRTRTAASRCARPTTRPSAHVAD